MESLWSAAGWIARDKKRSHAEINWLEDSVRLHWNGPDPVDTMTNTKIFDGGDHVMDWTSLWRHKLVASQQDVEDRRERSLRNANRQHRSNEGRKLVLQSYQNEKRADLRTLLHVSQGADPALVGSSSRRNKDKHVEADLAQLELLNVPTNDEKVDGEEGAEDDNFGEEGEEIDSAEVFQF